jgi:iduronate 2-sulfatase
VLLTLLSGGRAFAGGPAVDAQPRPNVLLICVDDLRPELGCFGKPYIHSPNIDALAARGVAFTRHYVQAPTCGASRFTLLTGRYGSAGNDALFRRAKQLTHKPADVPASMPHWFRANGYTTVSVGKVSHHPGGRGGNRWNSETELEMPLSWDASLLPASQWKDPRGWMHGLAHGEVRDDKRRPDGKVEMDLFQAVDGGDEIYPDGPSVEVAMEQIDALSKSEKPFFLAVGILRPHLPFGAPKKYLDLYQDVELPPIAHPSKPDGRTTWHRSGEFMKYDSWGRDPRNDPDFATEVRRHYAACVSYADAQVGKLLSRLKAAGKSENTIVVLWGDHGWHLGEHGIWGKHALFEESLRSPLIVAGPGIEAGAARRDVVETIDIFPTLCELTQVGPPTEKSALPGDSLVPLLASDHSGQNPSSSHGRAFSYQGKARTVRTATHRAIVHGDGFVELYDHRTLAGETVNIADDFPDLRDQLADIIRERLGNR